MQGEKVTESPKGAYTDEMDGMPAILRGKYLEIVHHGNLHLSLTVI